MKIKKRLGILLSAFMLFSLSMSVTASENSKSTASSFHMPRTEMTVLQQAKWDAYLQSDEAIQDVKVGESKVVYQDSESILTATLTESYHVQAARSTAVTTYKTWKFTDTSTLGEQNVVFMVNLRCYWIKDGANSKITDLQGDYTIINPIYSLSWNGSQSSNLSHVLWLNVSKPANTSATLGLMAYCHSLSNPPTISFDVIS